MKYFKRLGVYKASKVTFNPLTCEAFSYAHWKFVARIDNYVMFNSYYYSNTTTRHQAKMRKLLAELNIKIDFDLPMRESLDSSLSVEQLIERSEEFLCDKFLNDVLKKQERYARSKKRKKALIAKQTTQLVGASYAQV
jgi:hypothetical protein